VCGAQQLVCILWSVSKAIVCVLAPRWEHMYMSALLSLFGSESRRVLRPSSLFRVARITVFEAGTPGIG